MLKIMKKSITLLLSSILVFGLVGCSNVSNGSRIVRISHGQQETHPHHLGMLAFEKYVESKLGDKYDIQIFPNALLGSTTKALELLQTGAIDFVSGNTGALEKFDNVYQIFNMPYLFDSVDAYHKVMDDKELMSSIYKSTTAAGFEAVTWFDAGTRSFYTKTPIRTVEDLKGKKIRVQQSPTNVRFMELLGAAATPMSFSEVYTAIQQGVVDGAENAEIILISMKHGEVAKYYLYDQHQMLPDLLIGNSKFLSGLSPDERKIFDEAAKEATLIANEKWVIQTDEAIEQAKSMGVEFIHTDIEKFKQKVLPLHQDILSENKKLQPIYDKVQEANKQVKEMR